MILTLRHNLMKLLGMAFEAPAMPPLAADRWAGQTLTIIGSSAGGLTVRDRRGAVDTIPLSYGLEQALANAVKDAHSDGPAGLVITRDQFEVDGLPFWQWIVLPQRASS